MSEWDNKIAYLEQSTKLFYNDDYIAFLVQTVWRIDKPVHVIDFGCGYGHLGLRLLPVLPAGSTYTGIDLGPALLAKAEELFRDTPYETRFIQGDALTVPLDRTYDLAVCHAVLLHMTQPPQLLARMKQAVIPGGMLACFEPHWNGNMTGYCFDGTPLSRVVPLGILQKLYENDAAATGKDGNIGIKLPLLLHQLGLRNIQCRVSDRVNIQLPSEDHAHEEALFTVQFQAPGERVPYIERLVARGLSEEEAGTLHAAEQRLHDIVDPMTAFVYAPQMKVSFGTV